MTRTELATAMPGDVLHLRAVLVAGQVDVAVVRIATAHAVHQLEVPASAIAGIDPMSDEALAVRLCGPLGRVVEPAA